MPKLKQLLIVDDNKVNRQVLCKILSDNYEVLEAENGMSALEILHNHYESISAVLLDLIMPVMDGYKVLEKMRSDMFLSKIPVIVTTANVDRDTEIKALSLGANDFLLKPYKPAIILHRLANTINFRETAALVNAVEKDTLTGLYNKEFFYKKAETLIKSGGDNAYDIICLDIERFKLVNDLFGMQTGDDLLKYVANIVKEHIQSNGIYGRIGSDLFACLCPHSICYDNTIFEKANKKINEFPISISINVRFGIYAVDKLNDPVSVMCDRAFIACNSIKGKYDTHYAYYSDEFRQKMLSEQTIIDSMKDALTEKQFEVFFQPKYDLKTEEIIGAEALVRWIHPTKGYMRPDEFIPLFEKNGFITDLDIYVWDQCCQKLRAWIDNGNTATPVSVNISRADIYNPELHHILLSIVQKYELSPKYLHLEITETAYTQDPEQLIEAVLRLKKLGFIIEMDDFGTGYSSLNMLSELPIDIIKLDMRFLQKEENKNSDRSILSFIISLAKWMDLNVVAEGVETVEQVNLLKSLNCEYAQGYYYATPLPQEQFEKLLLDSNIQKISTTQNIANKNIDGSNAKKQIMVVLDFESADYPALEKEYKHNYCVMRVDNELKITEIINAPSTQIYVVIVSLCDTVNFEKLNEVIDICKSSNIPIVILGNKNDKLKDKILTMHISDYVERPLDFSTLTLRLQNAYAYAKMKKFEQEKEINAAIIEMRRRSEHDVLTGLLNRAEFEIRIDNYFHGNDEPSGIFVILDIDNFKYVNDTFGHVVGDKVLYTVGERLNCIFPETEIIARIGGDEFAVFIPFKLSQPLLKEKMQRLCSPTVLKKENIKLSCSAGVCFTPEYGINHKDLYKNADTALLCAKRHGKSSFEIYNNDMKIATVSLLEQNTMHLLENSLEAMFVCDAITSEIIYINETACEVLKKEKSSCLGRRCYELFWDRCRHCERCSYIDNHRQDFYEETTLLKDKRTPVHIKARVEEWDGRKVKVHYLRIGSISEVAN